MRPEDFIAEIAPAARDSAFLTGIPASFTVAEGALESGWGNSRLATDGMNLFGIKADISWHGDTISMHTREFFHGQWIMVDSRWRKYPSWGACLSDHAQFLLSNPRYHSAILDSSYSGEAFARAVAAAGYATDPNYADKIVSIIRTHDLSQLDQPWVRSS